MRTVKFRGQRIDNGEWVYGYLYQLPLLNGVDGMMILTTDNYHEDNSIDPKYHLSFTLWIDLFPVKPETIGQFTGLKDKNSREIYEGDIVKCGNFVYQVVYEGERFASFTLHRKEDMFLHYFGEAMEAKDCEVIGNIYNNPELLKKE